MNISSEEAKVQMLIRNLLAGGAPNGISPADCGSWKEVALSLAEAQQAGGVKAVRKAFDVLARTYPDLARLVASDFCQLQGDKEQNKRVLMPVLAWIPTLVF